MPTLDDLIAKFPQINERNRNYVLGGILLAIFLIDYFIVMQPQLATLRTLGPEITVLKGDLNKVEEDLKKINVYQNQVKRLTAKLEVVNQKVKSREEVPLILERISHLANKHEVVIDQIMPLNESQELLLEDKEGEYYALPILIEARVGYHNFGKFLADIETDAVSLNVERLNFTNNENDNMKHLARITLNAVIFEQN